MCSIGPARHAGPAGPMCCGTLVISKVVRDGAARECRLYGSALGAFDEETGATNWAKDSTSAAEDVVLGR